MDTASIATEVDRLHQFFVAWFSGTADNDPAVLERELLSALGPELRYVLPGGECLARATLAEGLGQAHGINPEFRIKIDEVRLTASQGSLCVATYREWQRGAKNSAPENGRMSTAVFETDGAAPGGLRWLHIHETWLPEAVVSAYAFDF